MRVANFLFLILTLSHTPWLVQAADNNSGMWIGIFPNYQIDNQFSLSLQAEYRHIGEADLALLRPSLHRKLTDNFDLGVGYDLFTTKNTEQRPWLEANFYHKSNSLRQKFWLRMREEVRFISNNSRTAYRTRFMLSNNFVISETLHLHGILFDEVFFSQVNFNGSRDRYDRNWLGGRLRYSCNKLFYDIGAFWEHINNPQNSNGIVSIFSVGGNF